MNETKKLNKGKIIIILLLCIIIVMSFLLINLWAKYAFIYDHNNIVFITSFRQMCSDLSRDSSNEAQKNDIYKKVYSDTRVALSIASASSFANENPNIVKIIQYIDYFCVFQMLLDPEPLPEELLSDIRRLTMTGNDDTELSEKILEKLGTISKERKRVPA